MGGFIQSGRFGGAAAFGPSTIAGCVLWLDASDAASITSSAGAVSQWSDQSGGNRHVVQGTAANKPTTGATTQNGLNVISFDATDTLRFSGTAICASAFSIFAVFRKTGSNNTYESLPVTFSSSSSGAPLDGWNDKRWLGGNSFTGSYTAIQTQTNWGLMEWLATSAAITTLSEYKDGTLVSSGTVAATLPSAGQVITLASRDDGVTHLTGDIAHIVIYDVELGMTDRQTVEAALKLKWGTP